MNYKSQQHKTTFEKAVKKKAADSNKLMSAIYLLTADSKLWQIVQKHVMQNKIEFENVKLNVVSENAYTLYCAAKDMYFNTDSLSISDLSDTALISPKIFDVLCTAIRIRRLGLDSERGKNNQ